jgi:cytochrome c-type biogenesis protein CcmF
MPISDLLLGRKIIVGASCYDNVLIPTGLVLLVSAAAAPLLRWGAPPKRAQRRALFLAAGAGGFAAFVGHLAGVGHALTLLVVWLAVLAVAALIGGLLLDAGHGRRTGGSTLLRMLADNRRQYAGFLAHLGLACLAVGVSGSALSSRRCDLVMREGETAQWAGRVIHFVRLADRPLSDRLIVEAQLDVSRGGATATLLPAQHFHRRQNQWTAEVAIDSTWGGDFYAILHGGRRDGQISLTLVENPLMRWIWLGGCGLVLGATIGLWPAKKQKTRQASEPIPEPIAATWRKAA